MAVEELHLAPYIVESALANPDLSIFFRHLAPYILEAPAVNAAESVFINGANVYIVEGADEPADMSVRRVSMHILLSTKVADDRPSISTLTPYQIDGGRAARPGVALMGAKTYMITT